MMLMVVMCERDVGNTFQFSFAIDWCAARDLNVPQCKVELVTCSSVE